MHRTIRAIAAVPFLGGLFLGGLFLAGFWLPGLTPDAAAQDRASLNHFFCYEARTAAPTARSLDVRDSLDQQRRRRIEATQPVGYCNPAALVRSGRRFDVVDEADHLTIYEVPPFEPRLQDVAVENHLTAGAEVLELEMARWLMVPTRQRAPNRYRAPRRLDHYLCHGVVGGEGERGSVDLEDQFGRWPSTPVGRPLAVCHPTEVRLGRRSTPVENADTLLVCYEADRPFAAGIEGQSSFGDEDLSLTRAFAVCVPSVRRER